MTAAVPETPAAPGQAHPLDLPARAAYAAHYGLSGAQATAELTTCPEGEREHWRMVADAAITAGSFAARQPQAAPGPAGCACGHAQTGHAFSDDVCAVPDCPCDGYRHTAQPAPELAAPIVLNMDAPGPAAPYEPALIPERVVTGYGPTADAIRAEVDADNAKDRLIAKLHRDVDSLRANVERLRGLLNEARIAEPRELAAAMAALAGELEAEAFRLAPPGAPEDPPDMADYIRAEALSVAASRIRDRAGVPS